jgi:hypothetical protein
MDLKERFSAFTYIANDKVRRLVGTVKNVAARELLYAASSDNETYDQRTTALGS